MDETIKSILLVLSTVGMVIPFYFILSLICDSKLGIISTIIIVISSIVFGYIL